MFHWSYGGGREEELIDISLRRNGGETLETVTIGNSFEEVFFKEKKELVSEGQNGLVGDITMYFN